MTIFPSPTEFVSRAQQLDEDHPVLFDYLYETLGIALMHRRYGWVDDCLESVLERRASKILIVGCLMVTAPYKSFLHARQLLLLQAQTRFSNKLLKGLGL